VNLTRIRTHLNHNKAILAWIEDEGDEDESRILQALWVSNSIFFY